MDLKRFVTTPKTLVVTQRNGDVHVTLESNPGIWGWGKTETEAIGNLIQVFALELGFTITRTTAKK